MEILSDERVQASTGSAAGNLEDDQPNDGPFGITMDDLQDPESVQFYVKPGRVASENETSLVYAAVDLINEISLSDVSKQDRKSHVEAIINAVSAGVVASQNHLIASPMIEREKRRFLQDKVDPHLDSMVNSALINQGVFLLFAISFAIASITIPALAVAKPFAFLHIGLIAGRFISIFFMKQSRVSNFNVYFENKHRLRSPMASSALDVVLAFAAVLALRQGIVVIELGSATQGEGLSTRNINHWEAATLIGILIGLARLAFMELLRSLGSQGFGVSNKTSS